MLGVLIAVDRGSMAGSFLGYDQTPRAGSANPGAVVDVELVVCGVVDDRDGSGLGCRRAVWCTGAGRDVEEAVCRIGSEGGALADDRPSPYLDGLPCGDRDVGAGNRSRRDV